MKKTYLDQFISLLLLIKVELILYPVFSLYKLPKAWSKSLWNSRILLKGKWKQYMEQKWLLKFTLKSAQDWISLSYISTNSKIWLPSKKVPKWFLLEKRVD